MNAVRAVVAALAALAGLVLALARARPASAPAAPAAVVSAPADPVPAAEPPGSVPPEPSRGMRAARVALVGGGAVLTGAAFGLIAAGVPSGQWIGIAIWLAGALVLHDALLAPLLLVAGRLLRRAGTRLPWGAVAAVQAVLVVGGALTLLAFPALRAQAIGARNPSVLPFDYGAHLAVTWAVVGLAVVAVVVVARLRHRRRA